MADQNNTNKNNDWDRQKGRDINKKGGVAGQEEKDDTDMDTNEMNDEE